PVLGVEYIMLDGSISSSAAPCVTGPVTVSNTIVDAAGDRSTATVTIDVAAGPAVTVDAPALTNDSTPTITGTTNLPAGSTVSLLVTDSAGASQTVSATVAAGGTYSVDVPAALAGGACREVGSAPEPAGPRRAEHDERALQ